MGPSRLVQRAARRRQGDGQRAHANIRQFGACLVTALIFDCDGVLADTERFGHLPAFNATFADFGLPVRWDETEYAKRLTIGGGKERMASLFTDPQFVAAARIPAGEAERAELLATWHRSKTAWFRKLVA